MGTFSGNAFDSGTFDVYVPLGWDADTAPRPRRRRPTADQTQSNTPPSAHPPTVAESPVSAAPRTPRRQQDLPAADPSPPAQHHAAALDNNYPSPRQKITRPSSFDDGSADVPQRLLPDDIAQPEINRRRLTKPPTEFDLPTSNPSRAISSVDAPTRRRHSTTFRDDSSPTITVSPSKPPPPDQEAPARQFKVSQKHTSETLPTSRPVSATIIDDLPRTPVAKIRRKADLPDDAITKRKVVAIEDNQETPSRRRKALPTTTTDSSSQETRTSPFVQPPDDRRLKRTKQSILEPSPSIIARPDYTPEWTPRSRARILQPPHDLIFPLRGLLQISAPPYISEPRRRKRQLTNYHQDVLVRQPPVPPWDAISPATRTGKRSASQEPTIIRQAPPAIVPWGFDTDYSPRWSRPKAIIPDVIVLVPPVGPIPAPNLPINVFIGGGIPRTEIVAGPSADEIEDYYDELLEQSAKLRGVTPDVLGRDEYERERQHRRTEWRVPEPTKQTTCRFEPTLKPASYHRVMMLVGDARSRGLSVSETDAFTLRHRLHKFSTDLELKMLGGCVVKLSTSRPDDLVALPKLARLHLYELITWTRDSLFVFDDTTLTHKVPPIAWWALGAGWGLALGAELWREPRLPEPPETLGAKPKKSSRKNRRRRRR